VAAASPARAGEPLDGTFETPLGKVRIEQVGDSCVGKLLQSSRLCGLGEGEEVVRGRLLDGVFTGEVRACYPAKCREAEPWLFALAMATDERLAGGVASPDGDCPSLVFKSNAFAFVRQRPNTSSQPAARAAAHAQTGSSDEAPKPVPNPEAQELLRAGMALSQAGRFEAARQKLLRANEIAPINPEVLNQIAITYYARNDLAQAKVFYRRAIAAAPRFALAHYNLACVLAKENRPQEALQALRTAAETGYAAVAAMDGDQDLDSIRGDPAYREIRRIAERNAKAAR
jgi:tetratricopeptide (TPR) repeat protein